MALRTWIVVAVAAFLLPCCSKDSNTKSRENEDPSAPSTDGLPVFRDVTATSGVRFVHHNGATGKRYMPETLGGGVCFIDYDGDRRDDLYFVDSGEIFGVGVSPRKGGHRLYRNLGGLRFEDVTERAGVSGKGYGMGAVVGDYDRDGDLDLYVTCFGPNILYRNNGDGTFTDVTQEAGADDPRWSTGAAFLDYDRDGHQDLFIQNYVDYTLEKHRPCYVGGKLIYCTPDQFEGVPSRLLRNRGDGTFEDVSNATGIGAHLGKGLAVCVEDIDSDGYIDIYCANDSAPNFLFRNLEGKRFEEIGLPSGTAMSEDGKEEAGMGTDAADFDGDGRLDLVVSNFQGETNSIYRNDGELAFTEVSRASGTASTSFARLGFGIRFLDYDHDTWPDLLVANGHLYDNGLELDPPVEQPQPPSLFHNLGTGRFQDVTNASGDRFRQPMVARGLAVGDLDGDGDLDCVFAQNNSSPRIFSNEGGSRRSWVRFRLHDLRGATALGAQVMCRTGSRRQLATVRSGGSYLSQSEVVLHLGLGSASQVDELTLTWPDGTKETQGPFQSSQTWHWRQGQPAKSEQRRH